MKNILVGSSGFVGSNLMKSKEFDGLFNSKNIKDSYNTRPDLLVYAGVRAEKFIANKFPEKDLEAIKDAANNIRQIQAKKLVLISTIDVYPDPVNVDESSSILDSPASTAYGKNRYKLEEMVREISDDYLIVRLPALFGHNLKKNFIYDLINYIPSMLNQEKYKELLDQSKGLDKYYFLNDKAFYQVRELDLDDKTLLKNIFKELGFSALNFTDSRSIFQFYFLGNLWKDINLALENGLQVLNLASQPLSASEIYFSLFNESFENHLSNKVAHYDFKSLHYKLFAGENGYLYSKEAILKDIKNFVGGLL